jgi:hypothetical protein
VAVEASESDFYFHSVDDESETDQKDFFNETRLPHLVRLGMDWWPLILPICLALVFKFIHFPAVVVSIPVLLNSLPVLFKSLIL